MMTISISSPSSALAKKPLTFSRRSWRVLPRKRQDRMSSMNLLRRHNRSEPARAAVVSKCSNHSIPVEARLPRASKPRCRPSRQDNVHRARAHVSTGPALVLMGFGLSAGEVLMSAATIFAESPHVEALANAGLPSTGAICLRAGLITIWRDKKAAILMSKAWRTPAKRACLD